MKKPQIDYRFFWVLLGIEAIVLLAFVAPFLIGWYCGHGWGLLTVIADILGWLYLNQKYFRKNQLALSTRAIWLILLAGLAVVAVFEGLHFFH
jgi:hypothetical protein